MGIEENFGDKINSNGFDKRPLDAKKGGAPLSIKKELVKLLELDGKLIVKSKDVLKVSDNGDVTVQIPTKQLIALKLKQWAMSNKNKGADMLIKLMEQIDGKPKQTIDLTTDTVQQTEKEIKAQIKSIEQKLKNAGD